MSAQIADPYRGLVSFQQVLPTGNLKLAPVLDHENLYSHFDVPAPGVGRLTYVLLDENGETVRAFLACIMNGQVKGSPCVAFGYAVPEGLRNQGLAKQIVTHVIQDQILQARKAGHKSLYVEAVVDVKNIASQRVAEAVLAVERENIKDSESGLPAYRYTRRFDTSFSR
jgi:predicted acetyltransferase